MQLLILILHSQRHMAKVTAGMLASGIHGGSLLDCEGVLQAVGHNSVEPPPIFGSLRQYLNPDKGDMNKILISAIEDSQVETVKKIVNDVTGGLDKANTGILMTVPLINVEGLAK